MSRGQGWWIPVTNKGGMAEGRASRRKLASLVSSTSSVALSGPFHRSDPPSTRALESTPSCRAPQVRSNDSRQDLCPEGPRRAERGQPCRCPHLLHRISKAVRLI